MKTNEELKVALNQKLTDDQIYDNAVAEFDSITEKAFEIINNTIGGRGTFGYHPIFKIYSNADLYKNKELFKRFTDMVESRGYRHEYSAPHIAYCVYINQD